MRRLYFRLIVPDGPLRRFRLAEDFGDQRSVAEGTGLSRGAGIALAWCGLSAGCWLLAHGHVPGVSLEPLIALSNESGSQSWAMAIPQTGDGMLALSGGRVSSIRAPNAQAATALKGADVHSSPVYPPAAIRRELPRVTYTVSVLHQGGEYSGEYQREGARDERSASAQDLAIPSERSSVVEPPTPQDRPLAPREIESAPSPKTRVADVAQPEPPPPANQALPSKSSAASYDPFEADFVAVRPRLPLPGVERPKSAKVESEPAFVSKRQGRVGGSHVLHTGGGCQAVFDASNQVVNGSKGVVGTDATSEDYTAVLGRMNILSCRPSGPLSVQVCVAVSERRAVGTTVTTSPGNAAVASCIARQIAGMRFPASTGADLVRTRVDIE